MNPFRCFTAPLAAAVLLSFVPLAGAQDDKAAAFRRFTGTDGKSFYAVVTAKTGSSVTFKMQSTGKVVTQSMRALSEPDRLFVQKWSPFKNDLLNNAEFSTLTVQEMLELRGYQSFEFEIEGNHIFVSGEVAGKPMRFMIDTGAHSSIIHDGSAKEAGLEIGPYDQEIHGVAGSQKAAVTKVSSIKLGDAVIEGRKLLATDFLPLGGGPGKFDVIFGADFLRELDACISYREGRMFLKPDNIGKAAKPDPKAAAKAEFRQWTAAGGGKSFMAALTDKTETEATFRKAGVKEPVKLGIDKLSEADRDYISKWSKLRDELTKDPQWRTLTVKELLELRAYESFLYRLEGNHILVDGMVGGPSGETKTRFLIDTGADSCTMNYKFAKETAKLEVGTLGETKIRGIGGEADAAFTKIPLIKLGEAMIRDRVAVSAEIFKKRVGGEGNHDALFGAEFLRELDAVINYKEGRMFLKPDNSDKPADTKKDEPAKEEPKKEAPAKEDK